MLKYVLIIGMILCGYHLFGQSLVDSVPIKDSFQYKNQIKAFEKKVLFNHSVTFNKKDSNHFNRIFFRDSISSTKRSEWKSDSFLFSNHPYFRFTDPIQYYITIKRWKGKDVIFYSVIAIFILFGMLKNSFGRYISDLFSIFFRTSLRQRQIKDQMLQSPLPSISVNIFYLLSTGMFLALLLEHFKIEAEYNFWVLYLYCIVGLIVIYGLKFITLKVFGWIFQMSDSADTYIFIVFSTNKVIGIVLLPYLVILTFTDGYLNEAGLSLSIITVIGLFAYRYFLTYISIHRQLTISIFHFLLYFTALEIIPLLLINKLLFRFLIETP